VLPDEVPPHQHSGGPIRRAGVADHTGQEETFLPRPSRFVKDVQAPSRNRQGYDDVIAIIFRSVGRLTVAGIDRRRECRPGPAAGPDRAVKTPTICGRKSSRCVARSGFAGLSESRR